MRLFLHDSGRTLGEQIGDNRGMNPSQRGPVNISTRPAAPSDLDGINTVIGSAIDTWGLPARVRAHSGPMFELSAGALADLQALADALREGRTRA